MVLVQLAIIKASKNLSQDTLIGNARKYCHDYLSVE